MNQDNSPLDARIIYFSGCLNLETVLTYLEDRSERERKEYVNEQERVEEHLNGCKKYFSKMESFVNTYNIGDDLTGVTF